MDIGSKIKSARTEAGLTQEQAAEALGVSRQTISNWENEKTYPDIISVIKMSDIYNISLDRLLKEEKQMSDYYDYLEESTSVVKSKNKLAKLIIVIAYLVVWAISMAVFWIFMDGSDAMAYSIVFIWIIHPVMTFVISLIIGKNDFWGKLKWLAPLFFGVSFMLMGYSTFTLANMQAFHTVRMPDSGMFPVGAVVSLAGLAVGVLITFLKNRKKKNK